MESNIDSTTTGGASECFLWMNIRQKKGKRVVFEKTALEVWLASKRVGYVNTGGDESGSTLFYAPNAAQRWLSQP
jgi:hypothetical protein